MFILASAENFAYTADILSVRVCGAQAKKTEGEQVTVCFLCGEEILKNNNINNRSLQWSLFQKSRWTVLYGAPFVSKLFANVLLNVVVTYPIKCSCDSINQPLLFFSLISFYGSWCNIFYLDIVLLPWWNIFYLDIILLPWRNIFYLDIILLPWWNVFYLDIIWLPWWNISTLISFYYRDATFSTLISFCCRYAIFSTLISCYWRNATFSTLISFHYRDATFSTLISFYFRDASFSTLISFNCRVMFHFRPWYLCSPAMEQFCCLHITLLPWSSILYIDIILLPWCNIFYLDMILLPLWNIFVMLCYIFDL